MADPNVTPKVTVNGTDGTSARISGDYGNLVIEAAWMNLDASAWERVKAEGDRLLAVAQKAEAERLEGIAALADED